MPAGMRLGDMAKASSDSHGCPACPHPPIGPAIAGSPNVNINSMPAIREQDKGVHAACCGPNMWTAAKGSATVKINGKGAIRKDDKTTHCGGSGTVQGGSSDVTVGG